MIALGRELQKCGNRVTLLAIADVESKILAAGLNYCYGELHQAEGHKERGFDLFDLFVSPFP